MRTLITQHTSYNAWANAKIVELIKQHEQLLDTEIKSSFPSLRKTLFHIWDAEYIWLQRLKGESIDNWPSKLFDARIPLDKLTANSRSFHEFAKDKDDAYFLSSTEYKNLKGEVFSTSNHGIVMHCMNHSTFHRGQVVSMLRGLGYEGAVDSTDLISYLRL
jgi:uncharacterized damage-inducible protein DinB